ncbi:RNA helicase RNJ42_00530 [Nakaseomyces bracarensis]|uniref:RNA helicase n=1 Tax=Nakaseomyces bracarensis TaxID=273131 RepID=UPI0038716E13
MAKKKNTPSKSPETTKKKGKKEEPPAVEPVGKKRGKRVLTEEQKAQMQQNRAKVTSTASWTGKLPHTLLHEFCQRRGWNKVEYDMKKPSGKFLGVAKLSWTEPKNREIIEIRMTDPIYDKVTGIGAIEPQETAMEARHYAATVALYRVAYNTNTHMMLPPNHKSVWYKLDDYRKSLKKDDNATRQFCDDPFKQLLEDRKKKAQRDKITTAKNEQEAKENSAPILIKSVKGNNSQPLRESKAQNNRISKVKRGPQSEYTFPRKAWDNANFIDLGESSRQDIENCLKLNINWEDRLLKSAHVDEEERQKLEERLLQLDFRPAHVKEAMLYKDPLAFLLFNLPEDDFPKFFHKRKEDSKNVIEISNLPLQKQIKIEKLQEFPISKDEALYALELYSENEAAASGYLTQTLIPDLKITPTDISDEINTESLEIWNQELESLQSIFEEKVHIDENSQSITMSLIDKYDLRMKIYRTWDYPNSVPGILVSTFSKKIKLPNYIKKQILIKLLHYIKENQLVGSEMVYQIYEWLQENIENIIDNPGKLLSIEDMKSNRAKKSNEDRIINSKKKDRKQLKLTEQEIKSIMEEDKKRKSTSDYKEMVKLRKLLPAWSKQDTIIDMVKNNQVVLITGETGSGKSTQVVQFILDSIFNSNDPKNMKTNIICTQPRRISAIGLAERVASERCVPCGQEVGYTIRGVNKCSKFTKIRFVTTGVLVRILQNSLELLENTIIVIDEVHERSIDTDLVVTLLKSLLKKVKSLKIVLMSATVNVNLFHNYFPGLVSCHIEGRTFPIKDYFLEDILESLDFKIKRTKASEFSDDINDEGSEAELRPGADSKFFRSGQINYELICQLVNFVHNQLTAENNDGSIIVFLPGVAEINRLCRMLSSNDFEVLPLHSALSAEDQKLVFKKYRTKRKIVVSTNIAETSITIDDCVATIDSGKAKTMVYNPRDNTTRLIETFISQAEANQRRGRAGRVREGLSYKLFSKRLYQEDMVPMPMPEIKRVALNSLYLSVKAMGIRDVKKFLASGLEAPPLKALDMAEKLLISIGLIDSKEKVLTQLGKYVSLMPLVDPKHGKLILYGILFGCADICITIASILSLPSSPFIGGVDNRDKIKQILKQYETDGDLLSTARIIQTCMNISDNSDKNRFIKDNLLSYNKLRDIKSSNVQYYSVLKDLGFIPISYKANANDILNRNAKNKSILQAIIVGALYPNVARVQLPDMKFLATSAGSIEKDPEAKQIKCWIRNEEFQQKLEELKESEQEIDINTMSQLPLPANRAFIHPSSVLFKGDKLDASELQVLQNLDDVSYERKGKVPLASIPFLAYTSSNLTSKLFISNLSPVSTLALLLFGGVIRYDITSDAFLPGIVMDDWLPIRTWCKNGVLLNELRAILDDAIKVALESPDYADQEVSDVGSSSEVFQLVEKIVSVE